MIQESIKLVAPTPHPITSVRAHDWIEICAIQQTPKASSQNFRPVIYRVAELLEMTHSKQKPLLFVLDKVSGRPRLRFWIPTADFRQLSTLSDVLIEGYSRVNTKPTISHVTGHEVAKRIFTAQYTIRLSAVPRMLAAVADGCTLCYWCYYSTGSSPNALNGTALDIMLAQIPAIDIVKNFPSRYPHIPRERIANAAFAVYRSHVDGFLIMAKDAGRMRDMLERCYRNKQLEFGSRTRAVLAQFSTGQKISSTAAAWYDFVQRHIFAIDKLIALGNIIILSKPGYLGDHNDLSVSPFHKAVQDDGELRTAMSKDSAYLSARIMMSILYLTVANLGIRLQERYIFCYAITKACEELFGSSSEKALYAFKKILTASKM